MTDETAELSTKVFNWVDERHWDLVKDAVSRCPDVAIPTEERDHSLLYLVGSIGSSPVDAVRLIAKAYPEAITMTNTKYGDTPLHAVCRHSQTSSSRVQALLELVPLDAHEAMLHRNHFSGTVLHAAVCHNATISALEALIAANPKLIHIKTREQGTHALSALWFAYMQTIQGHMIIAQSLKTKDVPEAGHFARFWAKCALLAEASYGSDYQSRADMLHALVRAGVPFDMIRLTLCLHAQGIRQPDKDGNTLLHWCLLNRPYRLKESELIGLIVNEAPETATLLNNAGESPLHLAIINKMPWTDCMDKVVAAAPSMIHTRHNGLLPFQYMACTGGKYCLEATYHLLRQEPSYVPSGI